MLTGLKEYADVLGQATFRPYRAKEQPESSEDDDGSPTQPLRHQHLADERRQQVPTPPEPRSGSRSWLVTRGGARWEAVPNKQAAPESGLNWGF